MQIRQAAREAVLDLTPPRFSFLWWLRPTNVKRLQWPCALGCLALKGLSIPSVTTKLTTAVTDFLSVDVCFLLAVVVVFALIWERAMDLLKKVAKPLILAERKSIHIALKKWKAEQEASGVKFNEDIPLPIETNVK